MSKTERQGDNLKKKTIIVTIAVSLIFVVFIGFLIYEVATDPWNDMYGDRIEYPLAMVDVDDTSTYMLIKWQHSSPTSIYEVITDTQSIKDNADIFSVDNKGEIYGTTADGVFWLFKDGEQIDTSAFDNTLTREIEYGTLHFQEINELQYQLLIGSEVIEQSDNYSIVCNSKNANPYYYAFAHGNDLYSIKTVTLITSGSPLEKIPRPKEIANGILEFSASFPTYAGEETAHWYLRLSDLSLSQRYLNVRAIQNNKVVCTDSDYAGPKIVICDIFDKTMYYAEISGDFSEEADRLFLLSAEFTEDGKLLAEYIGNDGKTHTEMLSID